jgi:Concanavalin A-like lectin/glucanases superfamily
MRDFLRIFLLLVLGTLGSSAAEAQQQTVYADKLLIGTLTPSASPITVVGMPASQTGGILRTGTGGLVGTGLLGVADIPTNFTRRDVNETISGTWTFSALTTFSAGLTVNTAPAVFNAGLTVNTGPAVFNTGASVNTAPIVFVTGGTPAPPSQPARSTGSRTVLYPTVGTQFYDYGIGVENNTTWFSLPNSINYQWRFYADDTARAAAAIPGPAFPNHLVAELTSSRSFLPGLNYSGNLGLGNRKWLTLSVAELLVETLVAQDTLAATNGRQVIGMSATELTRDLPPGDAVFYVKQPFAINGDRVMLESRGKVEYLGIVGSAVDCSLNPNCGYTADYAYSITRNMDGSGANQFYAGDAILNMGQTGDGMIDMYAQRSTVSNGYPGFVLGDRPIAYYRMTGPSANGGPGNNGGGDAVMLDYSGNARNGTVTNWGSGTWQRQYTYTVGTTGGELGFYQNATSTSGVVINSPLFPDLADFTITMIVTHESTANHDYLAYAGWSEFAMYATAGTGALEVLHQGTDLPLGCSIPTGAGTYTTLAVVRDTARKRYDCFINGVKTGGVTYTTAHVADNTVGLWIGGIGSNYWRGFIDEVAVYDYLLPPDRIAAQFNQRLSNNTSLTSANAVGPTISGMFRQSNAFNDMAPRWAIGNLQGLYGFTATTYGVALGNPAAENLIATGTTLAFRSGTTPTLVMKGDSFAMGNPVPTALDTGTGLWFAYNSGNATFRVGNPTGNRMRWDGTKLSIGTDDVTIDERGITMNSAGLPDLQKRRFQFALGCGGSAGAAHMQGYTETNINYMNMEVPYVSGCEQQFRLAAGNFGIGQDAEVRLYANVNGSALYLRAYTNIGITAPIIRMSALPVSPESVGTNFDWVVQIRTGAAAGQLMIVPSGVLVNRVVNIGGCALTFTAGLLKETTCQ